MGELYIVNFGGKPAEVTPEITLIEDETAGNTHLGKLVTVVSQDLQVPTATFADASAQADLDLLQAWAKGRRI